MSWKWRLIPIIGGAGVLVAVAAAIMLAVGGPSVGTVVPDFAEHQVMGMEEEVALGAGKGVAAVSYGEVLNRMDSSTLEQDVEIKDRLIIRTADLSIVVDDTAESMAAIEDLVGQAEGWVVSSNIWEYDGAKQGNISVRVPAGRLDDFLGDVRTLANNVTSESISGQDVTEEYVDIQGQLVNLRATVDRVRSFLEQAETVEEALAVNAELSRLEGEVERITGRMKYLERTARYSSASIQIIPDELAQPVTIGRWQPEGTARETSPA